MATTLDAQTRQILDAAPGAKQAPGKRTVAAHLADAARAPRTKPYRAQDPLEHLPALAKQMAGTQAQFDAYVNSYYSKLDRAYDAAKGFLLSLLGKDHAPLGLESLMHEQLANIGYARDDLDALATVSLDAHASLAAYQSNLSQGRAEHIREVVGLTDQSASLKEKKAHLESIIDGYEKQDPEYHELYSGILAYERAGFGLRRDLLKKSQLVNYADGALAALAEHIGQVEDTVASIELAQTSYALAAEQIHELLPLMRLGEDLAQDRVWMLAQAKDLSAAMQRGIELTGKALVGFDALSTGMAGREGQVPSYQRRSYDAFAKIGSRTDGILRTRGL